MFYVKATGFQNDVERNQVIAEPQRFVLRRLQSGDADNSQFHIGYAAAIEAHMVRRPSGALEFSRDLADRYPYLNNKSAWNVQNRGPVRLNAQPSSLNSLIPSSTGKRTISDSERRFYLIEL